MALPTKEEFKNLNFADKLITWSKVIFGLALCIICLAISYYLLKFAFNSLF